MDNIITKIRKKKWAQENRDKVRASAKKWRDANREKERERLRQYKIKNRDKVHASARLYTSKNSKKINQYSCEYYKANRERKIKLGRKYRAEHPNKNSEYSQNRRARKIGNGGIITEKEWKELQEKYGNKCLCCGRKGIKLSLDHIIPLSKGGKHIIENAQPLCIPCNSRKNNKIIDYRLGA